MQNAAMKSELVSFDMPAPTMSSASPGRFSGQVAMPMNVSAEGLNLLVNAGGCNGVGVAIWPSKGGAILYAGEIMGKHMNGVGLMEFPSARSTWSLAAGKFENGEFNFGRASAGDVLDFVGSSWQELILSNIQTKTSWSASEFKGQWENGYPKQGITLLPDGSVHVGTWKDGKFHDSCLFVDSEGHWIKGIFQKGELIAVTFRSFVKCKVPSSSAHLLANADLANIPAHTLQGEYKQFIEIADKLASQGIEMSKLAKSISNIAFLKSEQVLGLPAHAVESSLKSLAHLVNKQPQIMTHHTMAPASSAALAKESKAHLGSSIAAVAQTLSSNPSQAPHLMQLITQLQNQSKRTATTQSIATPSTSAVTKAVVPQAAVATPNMQGMAKKVELLSLSPPVVSLKKEARILINGRCSSQKDLQNISVLCIAGFPPKFVSIPVVLKKIYTTNDKVNFRLELELTADAASGLVYFLFADTSKQGPYEIAETEGPCKALLSFNGKESEYHVAPLIILKNNDEVCKEIEEFFEDSRKNGMSGYESHYKKHADFLQHLGTLIGIWDLKTNTSSSIDHTAIHQIYTSLMQAAAQQALPQTLQFLNSKRKFFFKLRGDQERNAGEQEEKEDAKKAESSSETKTEQEEGEQKLDPKETETGDQENQENQEDRDQAHESVLDKKKRASSKLEGERRISPKRMKIIPPKESPGTK